MKHVFISFSGDDAELAEYLSRSMNHLFAGQARFFTSSAGLEPGDVWLDRIRKEAQLSDAILILLNPRTFSRPWINIEAGAFWVSGKPIFPLLHGGLTAGDLHRPLADYQTADINTETGLSRLIGILSDGFSMLAPPTYDAAKMRDQISLLDRGAMRLYTRWADLADALLVTTVMPDPEALSVYDIVSELSNSTCRTLRDGRTVELGGHSNDAILFTFRRIEPFGAADYLVVEIENSEKTRSFEYGLFMKVLHENDVLVPYFEYQRHSRDDQFTGLGNGFFPYDVQWVPEGQAVTIKVVLWRANVDRLRLRMYFV